MKDFLSQLDKVLENRIRLAIMSLLMVNEQLNFNTMKETLALTDGNLASHTATLEKQGYIKVMKKFEGKKPLTNYKATSKGRKAFENHLNALENILRAGSKRK